MPKLECSTLVTKTKDRKSSNQKKCKKPCQSSSSSSCCTDQCLDCCSTQFVRLNRFATYVTDAIMWNEFAVNENANNRCGEAILMPNALEFGDGNSGPPGAYYAETGCSGASGDSNLPVNLGDEEVSNAAYYYVNQFAYGPYEPGCHNDQVMGWYVNLQSGELQLFTEYEGVPVNATRACLSANISPTSTQRKQLKVLNSLFKLSKSAVKMVNGIPSEEGNIVEVCDCRGGRWLVYINVSAYDAEANALSCNYEFAVVACKLC